MSDSADRGLESVESFRQRARAWITANLSPIQDATGPASGDHDEAA